MRSTFELTQEQLRAWRDIKYRRKPDLRVRSEQEALTFLNDVKLATLFSARDMELPCLWEAICGGARPIPEHHNDPELGLTWEWKDTLPARKSILYGKFLRKKPVFISLGLLPHFYALSGNFGEEEDCLLQYQDGLLSEEAKRIYEVLLTEGPLPTSHIRRLARMAGKDVASRFDRAVTELQMGYHIVKVGISDANRWGYCYVYDLLMRQFPEQVAAARAIPEDEASESILTAYLETVLVATERQLGLLLGWETWRLERTLQHLVEAERIHRDVRIDEEEWVGLTSLLARVAERLR